MTQYAVKTGDVGGAIAGRAGVPWPVIWNHPNNKAVFDRCGGNDRMIKEGDILFLPDKQQVFIPPSKPATVKSVKTRDFFLKQAYKNAFGFDGTDDPAWDPTQGFAANRPRIFKLYDYYANLYLNNPDQFFWAGLGKMAGGAVVGGLDTYLTMPLHGEDFVTNRMVQIGKDIFHDLAWQHEAFLDGLDTILRLAQDRDQQRSGPAGMLSRKLYAKAWEKIGSGDPAKVFEGNAMLLENEQFTIIQPRYDEVLNRDDLQFEFHKTSVFTNNIHPYHRRFQLVLPSGDVTNQDDRWAWITEVDGMWAKWMVMPADERKRLVGLPLDDLLKQKWGSPLIDSLLPPGAFDDEDQG